MRRWTIPLLFVAVSLAACGDDEGGGGDDDPIDAADNGGEDADETPALSCEDYCDTIMANCTAAVEQYPDRATCLTTCATFEEGTADDTSGNTLGCRTYHAGAAPADPDLHCPHAGPGGAGACGSNCEGFCTIALAECNDVFADMDACMTECAGFPDDEAYDTSDTGGDTLACRLYHLVAATETPDPHCMHINEESPTCAPPPPP